ncbi:cytochrome-c peroxidase [Saltatorellus ferox]|uniref:cytochrome-c peroxidase n=1 Tax=Saltatorellus ferox TaxID=2528018 RepID=UPI003AF36BB8
MARSGGVRLATVWLGVALFAVGCGHPETPGRGGSEADSTAIEAKAWIPPLSPDALKRTLRLSPVPAVPVDPTNRVSGNPDAAELGRHLFHSRALSRAGTIACATCHDPRESFADGKKLSMGVMQLERHAPSLWNVAHLRWFFWDGRADSLWNQALVPLEDPLEHAFTRSDVVRTIHGEPTLRTLYETVFGPMPPFDDAERFPPAARPVPADDRAHQLAAAHAKRQRARAGIQGTATTGEHHTHLYGTGFYHPHQRAWDSMTPEDQEAVTRAFVNAGKSIAAFQERLVSARAPFDVFVEGLREHDPDKVAALDPAALRGLELFTGKAQCIVCHHGPLFTDYEFHDTQVPSNESLLWSDSDGQAEPPRRPEDAPPEDLGRVHGVERLRASEFGVGSRWSDDPNGPSRVKVDYLPRHLHEGSPEFKTPSLRNVALTAPYMHNGVFDTLEQVVEFYNTRETARPASGQSERILQPLHLSPSEAEDLVTFLESLTDDSLDLSSVRAPR